MDKAEPLLNDGQNEKQNSDGLHGPTVVKINNPELKEQKEREGWGGRLDFILTCIGFAVGLGNMWRFPYLCYKSGGGAFFIPYFIFLFFCGIPLVFLEVSFGQYASRSPITVWNVSPMFKGIGVGMTIVSAIVCIYYNVIVAWTIYFIYMSLRSELPWSSCNNEWNTENCADLHHNMTSPNVTFSNVTSRMIVNVSSQTVIYEKLVNPNTVTASEEFWERHVLELTGGIEEPGSIRWELFASLVVAWIFVFLCLFKGVKVLGKLMHVFAPFPYFVLLVLLIRGVTLEGAMTGIRYYITPRWELLSNFQVWGDAALQIFYSVGPAWGGLITMASYNRFNHNCYRDAMILPLVNCGTSIFGGFVIFSILGFMAHETGQDIDKVVTQGPGLTFVVYPEAVTRLPISPLWAVLFFLMIFVIGLDSQFCMLETVVSSFIDEYPKILRHRKTLIVGLVCLVEFVLGLPCITQGGIYVLQIMDWYCASFSLMLLSLGECLVIGWVYGVDRFYEDIERMIGYKPCKWWKYCWCYITPALVFGIWLFSVTQLKPVTYGDVAYPHWAVVLGWILGVISIVPTPIIILYQISKEKGSLKERVYKLTRPTAKWGPAHLKGNDIVMTTYTKKS